MTPSERATIADRKVTACTVVAAPPAEVFALLANPQRHHEYDGSGSVRGAVSGPESLALGDRFGMDMKIEVVEFEPDRRIAWCHFARARYVGSLVRCGIALARFPQGNAASIRDTLRRLQQIFGTPTTP